MAIGERIKAARDARRMTQAELGALCGTTKQTIFKYEAGIVTNIPLDRLEKIAEVLGVTPAYLMGWDENTYKKLQDIAYEKFQMDEFMQLDPSIREALLSHASHAAVRIPVLGDVAAGVPIEAVEDILDYEEITPEQAATGRFFGLRIKGDSMEPRVCEGDVVIVRQQEDADNGDVAVILVNGDSATVKRIKHIDGGLLLISANPAYEPRYFSPAEIASLPVRIIGKVVELRGKL